MSIVPEGPRGAGDDMSFQSLAENTPIGIYKTDAAGHRTYVNKTWREITGLTNEEAYGSGWARVIFNEDRQLVVEAWRQAVASQSDFKLEFRFDNPTKGLRWVRNQATLLRNPSGAVIGYIGSIEDITQQKLAEQKLLESEQRYRLLSDNSGDIIALADDERKLVYVSPSVTEILGYRPEELIGTQISELIHEEDRLAVKAKGDSIRGHQEDISRLVVRMRKKNGEYRWVESQVKLFHAEYSGKQLVQASIRDIHQTKLLQEKLKESERRYRLLSENSGDIILLADIERRIEYISPSVKEMLGYEPEEIIGKRVLDFTHPEDLDLVKLRGDAVRQSKLPIARIVMRLRKKAGDYLWVEAQIKILKADHSEKQLVLASIRDITERKELEDALTEAKHRAEEASKAKTMFLSTMSHEIRTPMNAIIGLTNLMLEENPREDQQESLNLLKFSGENLLAIINDILDFNKIEAGKVELEEITYNLKEILGYHVSLLKGRATEKRIALKLEINGELPDFVIGDPVRLGQVFNNLIGNAIKFTEEGFVTVNVSLLEQKEKNHLINFCIRDTGIGIKPEKIDEVFENFTQASTDTTRKYGGTGLGLAISQRLIRLMGSKIELVSTYGKGSEFSFALQMKESKSSPLVKPELHSAEEPRKGINVLLVEDNKVNQVVAGNFLRKWGMSVDYANHGMEACEMVTQKTYDIVLMDLQMPVMDGHEATRLIRAMNAPQFKSLPILALTASAMLDVRQKLDETGFNGFVSKPFQPQELKNKILSMVDKPAGNSKAGKKYNATFNEFMNENVEMKRELTGLFIDNLQELKAALLASVENQKPSGFSKAIHKAKTTLAIINDQEFSTAAFEINQRLSQNKTVKNSDLNDFNRMADELIKVLEEELILQR